MAQGTYTHTTFAQAKTRLASLLGDPTMTFYGDAELGRYIVEALHWWGLVAQYWRDSARLTLNQGQAFYDIRDVTLGDGSDAQGFSVTDRELINDALYQMMEPPITNWALGYVGSEMFDLEEIADVLSKSRDDILRQTGCVVEERTYDVAGGQDRLELDEDTIHIVRASVEELGDDETGDKLPMWPIDYWQAQAQVDTAGTFSPGRPKAYVTTYTPTLAVDLYPPARTQCKVRLYVVRSGAALAPRVSATTLGVPDDVAWIVKYRMMDDLVGGDGLARAPGLSDYCRRRWQEGVEALAQYQSLMWSTLEGKRMTISSLGQLDAQRPTWENDEGTVKSLHMLSWNLFAAYKQTESEVVVELEVVKRAPVPVVDGDFIQVGLEQMQAIYDYSQHVAMVKCQGPELAATMSLYEEAKAAAMEHQAALAGSSVNWLQQQRLNREDRLMRPYRRTELVQEAAREAANA